MLLQIPEGEVPRNIPLFIVLHGFSDAGNSVAQLQKYLESNAKLRTLYTFNNDDYLDYRARRPTITFEVDHLKNYDPQKLTLSLAEDELGSPFFVLMGYEPDFRWEAFVEKVIQFVSKFEVSTTVWTHSIPMPVPHTRPIGVTVSGSREDLIEERSVWQPTTRLSASVSHVIEAKLYAEQLMVTGFVLLVPHYLANTDFPEALKVSLECFMDATGLLFSTEAIVGEQESFAQQVDEQVNASEESLEMVKNLENRYDDYMRSKDLGEEDDFEDEPLPTENLPTGEELAGDFERFLAEWGGDLGGDSKENTD